MARVFAAAVFSILVGLELRVLRNASGYAAGATALVILMPGVIYLPGTVLFEPIASGVQGLIAAYLVYACLWMLRRG